MWISNRVRLHRKNQFFVKSGDLRERNGLDVSEPRHNSLEIKLRVLRKFRLILVEIGQELIKNVEISFFFGNLLLSISGMKKKRPQFINKIASFIACLIHFRKLNFIWCLYYLRLSKLHETMIGHGNDRKFQNQILVPNKQYYRRSKIFLRLPATVGSIIKRLMRDFACRWLNCVRYHFNSNSGIINVDAIVRASHTHNPSVSVCVK